ncbi:MAG: leucine-rich repeat domain-containing protein [Bacteroidales bacterium]|nr:leucine-rich repeat domain-containing protein [Candidatus Scybalocola fimicaballi]
MIKSIFDDLGKLIFHIGITVAAITLFRHFCLEFVVLRWTVFTLYSLVLIPIYVEIVKDWEKSGSNFGEVFGFALICNYLLISFLFGFGNYISFWKENMPIVGTSWILYSMACNYIISWKRSPQKGLDIVDKEKSTESHIVICDGVEEIPSNVFKYNRKMTNITIPNSVKYIASEAFWGCESLVEIVIPDSVKSIGSNAFWYCSSLKKVKLPCSIKEIDSAVFKHCRSLNDVVIPDSVKKIGSSAFEKCTSLKNIVIPASTKVDETAFEGSGMEKDGTKALHDESIKVSNSNK